jgi:succinate-acetate transporter protein
MACGNTLGATGFTVYGLWWISFGWYLSPWSNIAAAYGENPTEMGYSEHFLCLRISTVPVQLT